MALKGLMESLFPQPDKTIAETERDGYDVPETEVSKTGNKMILVEPRAYSESTQIADHLKRRNSVVVNLKRVTADQAKRIVDFLSGTIYAIGGAIQKLGGGIVLCTPKNVNVEGKISEEITNSNKATRGKKDSEDKDDEDFF